MTDENPADLIQRQLAAYNAKDANGWLATYAHNAEQFALHGDLLAQGHTEMRARILLRFSEPDLHAELISRTVMNNVVVDHEIITRNFPDGRGTIEMLCIYEVEGGLIRKASFALGKAVLESP